MRTGVATVPLDYGKCPKWLFERMTRLSRIILIAIAQEFGKDEILKRLADPIWFQSLGCVIAFDWNSSGLTTTTLGAIKQGLRGIEKDLGIFVCGGKGKTSRKTPEQIKEWAEKIGFTQNKTESLVYASKMAAKVDSSLIQDGFQIYHHNFIFSDSGQWAVVQQGMNTEFKQARRYHWASFSQQGGIKEGNFIEEPHTGIVSDLKTNPLNLISSQSKENRNISVGLATEAPRTFIKDIKIISEKSNSLLKQRRFENFAEMELENIEFYSHPVLKEKFDLRRLEKIILTVKSQEPKNYEQLVSLPGVGPKTIRALSLVAEVIYGAKPSYEDPARYSFAHGGKDGTPYFPERSQIDKTIEVLEKAIYKSYLPRSEKLAAQARLDSYFNRKIKG